METNQLNKIIINYIDDNFMLSMTLMRS